MVKFDVSRTGADPSTVSFKRITVAVKFISRCESDSVMFRCTPDSVMLEGNPDPGSVLASGVMGPGVTGAGNRGPPILDGLSTRTFFNGCFRGGIGSCT